MKTPDETAIPRSKYRGRDVDRIAENEADHFIRCPTCNGSINCRDLGSVFDHKGHLPHPTQDQLQ